MHIREYSFPFIRQSVSRAYSDLEVYQRYDYDWQRHVIEAFRHFASSRPRQEVEEDLEYKAIGFKPKRGAFNAFRYFVCQFCPDLAFGWLRYEREFVRVPCHITRNIKVYNLLPVTPNDYRQQYGRYYKVAMMRPPNAGEWLAECTPLTPTEREANYIDSIQHDHDLCNRYRDDLRDYRA